jgi:integrase
MPEDARKKKNPPDRRELKDRTLKALKPEDAGVIWDVLMPGMAVRVSKKGKRSFYAVRRCAGAQQPTWVMLGVYPVISLAEARAKAREALGALAQGQDPAALVEAKRRQKEETERQRKANTFGTVVELFIRQHLPRLRTARSVEAMIRRELIPVLGDKPIGEIRRRDVIALIEGIVAQGEPSPGGARPKRGGRHAAGHAFAALSKLFNWAVARDIEGLDANPCGGLKLADLLGSAQARDRVLNDDEIVAVWQAAETMKRANGPDAPPDPFGALFQVLLLTGQRKNEIARCSWTEITDLDGAFPTLTVPAERMKGMNGKAAAHTVPLTPAVVAILREMPQFTAGDFVFTTTGGRRPISGFSKAEQQARALAGIPHWQTHDLRRTARTNLSATGTNTFIGELVIGHRQSGVHAVYDLHKYETEKRAALLAWEKHLLSLVKPEPAAPNVVTLREAAA